MGFLTAIAGIGGALVGGLFNNKSTDKAADAAVDANKAAIDLQREQFNWLKQQMQPTIDRGNQAANLLGMNYGLEPINYRANGQIGYSNQSIPGGVNYGQPNYTQYVNSNPDIRDAWKTNSHGVRDRFSSVDQFGQFHANTFNDRPVPTYGQSPTAGLGRDLTGTSAAGGTQAQTPADLQKQSYDRFLGSGHNKAATEVTETDFDLIQGSMGAGGKLYSGSALGAMGDRLSRNRYGAFIDYNNGLGTLAGTGTSATNSLGAAGQNYANNAGNLLSSNGQIRASSYTQQGNNLQNVLSGIAGGVGGMNTGGFFG